MSVSASTPLDWKPVGGGDPGTATSFTATIKTSKGDFNVTIQSSCPKELQKLMKQIENTALGVFTTIINEVWEEQVTTRLELVNINPDKIDDAELRRYDKAGEKPKLAKKEWTNQKVTNLFSKAFPRPGPGSGTPSQHTGQVPDGSSPSVASRIPHSYTQLQSQSGPIQAQITIRPAMPHSVTHSASASQSEPIEQHLTQQCSQKMGAGDHKGALGILQSARDENFLPPKLQLVLATYYLRGADGVDKDFPKAKALLEELQKTKFEGNATKLLTELHEATRDSEISSELNKFDSRDYTKLYEKFFPDDSGDLNDYTKLLGTYYEANKKDYKDIPDFISKLRAKLKTDDDGLLAKIKDFSLNPAAAKQTTPAFSAPTPAALSAAVQSEQSVAQAESQSPSLVRDDSEQSVNANAFSDIKGAYQEETTEALLFLQQHYRTFAQEKGRVGLQASNIGIDDLAKLLNLKKMDVAKLIIECADLKKISLDQFLINSNQLAQSTKVSSMDVIFYELTTFRSPLQQLENAVKAVDIFAPTWEELLNPLSRTGSKPVSQLDVAKWLIKLAGDEGKSIPEVIGGIIGSTEYWGKFLANEISSKYNEYLKAVSSSTSGLALSTERTSTGPSFVGTSTAALAASSASSEPVHAANSAIIAGKDKQALLAEALAQHKKKVKTKNLGEGGSKKAPSKSVASAAGPKMPETAAGTPKTKEQPKSEQEKDELSPDE